MITLKRFAGFFLLKAFSFMISFDHNTVLEISLKSHLFIYPHFQYKGSQAREHKLIGPRLQR